MVTASIIENLNIQMATEFQDNDDKRNIALVGFKEAAGSALNGNTSTVLNQTNLKEKAKAMMIRYT